MLIDWALLCHEIDDDAFDVWYITKSLFKSFILVLREHQIDHGRGSYFLEDTLELGCIIKRHDFGVGARQPVIDLLLVYWELVVCD